MSRQQQETHPRSAISSFGTEGESKQSRPTLVCNLLVDETLITAFDAPTYLAITATWRQRCASIINRYQGTIGVCDATFVTATTAKNQTSYNNSDGQALLSAGLAIVTATESIATQLTHPLTVAVSVTDQQAHFQSIMPLINTSSVVITESMRDRATPHFILVEFNTSSNVPPVPLWQVVSEKPSHTDQHH